MAWLLLIVEIILSLALLAFMAMNTAFQGEYVRQTTLAGTVIEWLKWLVLLTPLVAAGWSATRPAEGRLGFGIWFGLFIVCGAIGFGLMILKEQVVPTRGSGTVATEAPADTSMTQDVPPENRD